MKKKNSIKGQFSPRDSPVSTDRSAVPMCTAVSVLKCVSDGFIRV